METTVWIACLIAGCALLAWGIGPWCLGRAEDHHTQELLRQIHRMEEEGGR